MYLGGSSCREGTRNRPAARAPWAWPRRSSRRTHTLACMAGKWARTCWTSTSREGRPHTCRQTTRGPSASDLPQSGSLVGSLRESSCSSGSRREPGKQAASPSAAGSSCRRGSRVGPHWPEGRTAQEGTQPAPLTAPDSTRRQGKRQSHLKLEGRIRHPCTGGSLQRSGHPRCHGRYLQDMPWAQRCCWDKSGQVGRAPRHPEHPGPHGNTHSPRGRQGTNRCWSAPRGRCTSPPGRPADWTHPEGSRSRGDKRRPSGRRGSSGSRGDRRRSRGPTEPRGHHGRCRLGTSPAQSCR